MTFKEVLEMSNEEVFEFLHSKQRKVYEKDKAYCAAVERAIEALYKQIPKKPHKNTQSPNFLCPSCGGFTYLYDEYCKYCGQALDWSDSR